MMPSSSRVFDHQLIFYIMYGLRQFHHRQNKGEDRRGESWQKNKSYLTNMYMLTVNNHREKKSRVQNSSSSTVERKRVVEYRGKE
jgi:hypothetical protein